MSLAYGVNGEIGLVLENNYGDYSDWSRSMLMDRIVETLNYMLTYADDPVERKEIRAMLRSNPKMNRIADDFIEEHSDYMTKVK